MRKGEEGRRRDQRGIGCGDEASGSRGNKRDRGDKEVKRDTRSQGVKESL